MARSLFRFLSGASQGVLIEGDGVFLRPPVPADFEPWRALRQASRGFLEPWEPTWGSDELTRPAFRSRLRRYEQDHLAGHALALFLFLDNGRLAGGLTLGSIRRGAAQSCTLGYWMGEAHAGRGHMHAALKAVVPYAFEAMRLHRIEAACIPDNMRSLALLEKAGFRREGYLRQYLKINGVWRDHLLYARIAGDAVAGDAIAGDAIAGDAGDAVRDGDTAAPGQPSAGPRQQTQAERRTTDA